MFTNTFKQHVIDQFDKRKIINQDNSVQDSINWLNRTPFVFAYSNLRYEQSETKDPKTQHNMKWSVLSSFTVTGSEGYTAQNYILKNKQSFYDFYDNNTDFGIIPKPHITSLDVRGRGNNGTLKDINLQIVCYSFQQFNNIRRYFSVPCTSVFLQFGYFVSQNDIYRSIVPPVFCGYNTLTNNDNYDKSYLNMAKYYDNLDSNNIVNVDGLIAIVYGFDVSQQPGNIFKLRVNMMCKGNSEILNYIKPDLKMKFGGDSNTSNNKPLYPGDISRFASLGNWQGHRITQGYHSKHKAVDIDLKANEPLYAPFDCTIQGTFYDKDSGNNVRLTYQSGTTNVYVSYSHCNKFPSNIKAGVKVKGGTIVAYGGNTGHCIPSPAVPGQGESGTHLHLVVKVNGNRVDPRNTHIRGRVFTKVGQGSPTSEETYTSNTSNTSNTSSNNETVSNVSQVPQKTPDNNLTTYIRGLSQKINVGKHSIVLNTNGERYVSFDWVNCVIIQLLRQTILTTFTDKNSKPLPVSNGYEPLYFFDIQQDFNAEFYSNDIDVAILPTNNSIGYPLKYTNTEGQPKYNRTTSEWNDSEKSLFNKINDLISLYKSVGLEIFKNNPNSFAEYMKEKGTYVSAIENYYIKKFLGQIQQNEIQANGLLSKSKQSFFGYLGHVYFRLQSILQLLKDQNNLTIDGFMTGLTDKITSATNRGLVCSTSFNHRTEKFSIFQHSLNFSASSNIYYIPNFGPGSIVKQITYNLKMPDGYKVTIFQAYGANGGVMNDLFDAMFSGGKPQDIYLYKNILIGAAIQENVTINYQGQLDENLIIAEKTIVNGKISVSELLKDSVKGAVNLYNQALLNVKKETIKKETGHRSISSIYAIQVQIIFDFISNIDWGQVFKLEYNPLGWQTKFYVSDIQYRVQSGNAQTIIKGVMFG